MKRLRTREGGAQRDLLGRDRRDEGLERVRRRAAAGSRGARRRCAASTGSVVGEGVERRRGRTGRRGSGARRRRARRRPGVILTPPGASSIRTSVPVEDAVHAALVPEVREVGAERAEPLGRELEVERLRKRDRGRRRGSRRSARRGSLARRGSSARPARREDEVGRLGGAAVGVAVADVDELVVAGELLHDRALARLAAGVAASRRSATARASRRARVDAVRVQLDLDALALEDRLDQLVEAARDDDDAPAPLARELDELAEAGADAHVLEHPVRRPRRAASCTGSNSRVITSRSGSVSVVEALVDLLRRPRGRRSRGRSCPAGPSR